MNRENFNKVINAIATESLGIGFNMDLLFSHIEPEDEDWFTVTDWQGKECDTAACIAGHAYVLALGEDVAKGVGIVDIAAEWLGIDEVTAHWLFYPDADSITNYKDITPRQAVTVLRRLRDGHDVTWDQMGPAGFVRFTGRRRGHTGTFYAINLPCPKVPHNINEAIGVAYNAGYEVAAMARWGALPVLLEGDELAEPLC